MNLWNLCIFTIFAESMQLLKRCQKHVMDNYNYKSLMKSWLLQMKIQGSDASREISIMRIKLSYSQIGDQKLTFRNHKKREAKERN